MVGVLSLIVVGVWLTYQIYSALTRSQITEEQAAAIVPIDERISPEVLENLSGRRRFLTSELSNIVFNIEEGSPSASIEGGSFGLTQ